MIVKLLTEYHLEFLSLKGGCRGSSESTHDEMPHCWKSHALAHIVLPASARQRNVIQMALRCWTFRYVLGKVPGNPGTAFWYLLLDLVDGVCGGSIKCPAPSYKHNCTR